MTSFILFDTEYTTWEGAQDCGWMGENQHREIVQIGALKVDRETMDVIEEFQVLVKPTLNPGLSEFFQQLTGITQEQVDRDGVTFDQGYQRFSAFCGHALVFSYGNDAVILGENIALNHCHGRNAFRRDGMGFVNIGPYLHRIEPKLLAFNSGRLWSALGLAKPHELDEHDALFDCHSILAALRHFQGLGHELPF